MFTASQEVAPQLSAPSVVGGAVFHLYGADAPNAGGADLGTYTINAADGAPQQNTLECTNACGGIGTQPWDLSVLVSEPDVHVTETVNALPYTVPDAPVDIQITLDNRTTTGGTAKQVGLVGTLPWAFDVNKSILAGAGASACTLAYGGLSCTIDSMAPGASFSVTVRTIPIVAGVQSVCVQAWLFYGNQPDANPADNSACATVTVETDSDGDGYPDTVETALGKNPLQACPIMRADLNANGKVDILDLSLLASYMSRAPYPWRVDQDLDGRLTILDFAKMAALFGKDISSCP